MDKFVYQIVKFEKEQFIEIHEYSINDKQQVNVAKKEIPHVIYIKLEDFNRLNIKSDQIILADKKFKDKNGENVVKIEIFSKEMYDFFSKSLRDEEIREYEGDLSVQSLHLVNNNIKLAQNNNYIPLKYISVDIETIGNVNEQEIVLIALQSPSKDIKNTVYSNMDKLDDKAKERVRSIKGKEYVIEIFDNEKDMLTKFIEDVKNADIQIIIGWNVIDFDFKVIKENLEKYDLNFELSKYEGETKLRLNRDFFRSSTLTAPGVIVFDVIALLKMNFIIFDDYKLDTVAKAVLKDSKIELENDENADDSVEEKIHAIEYMFRNDIVRLVDYNFKDALLTSQIVEELNLLELMCKRSILTNTPLERIKSPIATLDIMYLPELHRRGYVATSNFNFGDSTPIEGAFVLDPKKGFYEDVFVFDFKSLYPSIIMTFNLDPFTISDLGDIESPNGAKFVREPGILPEIILKLSEERDRAKVEKDQVKSFALKTTMNSFYGAVASPKCRLNNKDVGEAITSFGREIIQMANAELEKLGHKPIYGDTDSVFVKANKKFNSLDEKKEFGKEISEELNKYFNNWVSNKFKMKSFLNIEFEKVFSKFFIATKKRYVGYDDLSSETLYTGMEAIRGDWTELARNFQREIVDLIFFNGDKEKIKEFILSYVNKLKKGEFDHLLVYSKKITKPLAMYTKTTPPHVRAARELSNFSGRTVKYVLTVDGPKHVKLTSDDVRYDYEHYINKQLKGVSDDLLDSYGVDFEAVVMSIKQKGLDQFF